MGNILRHEYHRVRDETLLDILRVHLPALRLVAMAMLERLEPDQSSG
nr:HepT-like ribonuclease domain-containing protein [Bosea sp. (in: a-proteobacteria)]